MTTARPDSLGHPPHRLADSIPRWQISPREWVGVVLVAVGVVAVFISYERFNFAPPEWRWPSFWAYDPQPPPGGVLIQPYDPNFDAAPSGVPDPGSQTHTFVLRSWLDAKLPFVPLLAVPYLSLFVVIAVIPALNLWLSSFRRFLTVGVALIVSQLFLDVAYLLFQTEVLRDADAQAEVARGGFGASLVELVWGNDAPFNGYPSGHVTWSTILILSLWRLRRVIPKTAWILMLWVALIWPATVMLRQHYLMDVYAGLFVGFASYWAVMFAVERPRLVPRDELPTGWPQRPRVSPSTLPTSSPSNSPGALND